VTNQSLGFAVATARKNDAKQRAKLLLMHYGDTLAEELGIDLVQNAPSEFFRLLIAALLLSARISHTVALNSAQIVFQRGWTTAAKLAATTWKQRVAALDEGGYVRYDERTSTMLGETASMLLERYSGDLRKLQEAAESDPDEERKLLKQFKGIGDVGVNIFFREAQLAWPELFPFADEKVTASAGALGLPSDPHQLAELVTDRQDFVRLVSALVRARLEHKQKELREILAA
jgi:endonuclease III